MSRVLVTGVNGFIGRRLALTLSKQGHEIVGVSLEPHGNRLPPNIEYHQLDLTNHGEVSAFLCGTQFEAVVHLAALVHVRSQKLGFEDYAVTNYRASEFLFRKAIEYGVSRLVFASTVEVYGPQPNGTVVNEETQCRPDSDYARTKLLAEHSLRSLAELSHTPYCILRFAPVYAPDFRLNFDKRLYLRPPSVAYIVGTGNYQLSLCSVSNIEAWIERWLQSQSPPTGVFNIADRESRTARELLKLERLHQRASTVIPLPTWPCLAALAIRETLNAARGVDPGMYTTGNFRKLGRSTIYSNSRAEAALGQLPGTVELDLYEEGGSR